MNQLTILKKMRGLKATQTQPAFKKSKPYSENILTPVSLSGVISPWIENLGVAHTSDYKLISYNGLEYFIVADPEWREILSTYCWEEVKVIGLLNISNMTLIPQKVYPKGPSGEKESVIEWASSKSDELVKKMIENVNDLVVLPATASTAMAA